MYSKSLLNKCRLLLCLLLSLCMVQAYAQSTGSTNGPITFSSKQVLIADIIDRLQSAYKYKVSYDADLNTAKTITLPSASLSLSDLLKQVERQASVGIRNNNGNIVIKRLQSVLLSGVVLSADDNQPLAGVTITDSKRRNYGSTSTNGTFNVRVEQGETISFSMVGYETFKRQAIKAEAGLSIKLQPTNTALSEVVVTALGIKREEKALGYAVTKVKGEELTQALPNNWTEALSGRVAGLNLIRSNGGPDGSNKIILRGESNLTGDNDALIVVDGVMINYGAGRRTGDGNNAYLDGESPTDFGSGLNDINPEDIEDITVLKGPSAAALYGQRGANGAIMITTKSGRVKKGIGVTFNSNTSIQQVNRWPDYQYEYGQGDGGVNYYSYGATADGGSTRSTSSAWGARFDGQSYFQYDPVTRTGGTIRTPWVAYPDQTKKFFETGKTFTNSITVEGGNDKSSIRFSATNLKNTWIIPNTGFDRNSVALSVNQKTSDKLQVSAKVNYTKRTSDNLPSTGYNNQSIMYWNMFWVPSASLDWIKNYWVPGREGISQSYPFSSYPDNPYLIANEMLNKSNRNDLTGNIQATYNFTKDLSLMVRTAVTMSYDQRSQQRPFDTEKFRKGMFRTQNLFSQEITNDFLLRYNKKIAKDFHLTLTAGGSMLNNNFTQDDVRADSLKYPGVFTLANAAGVLDTRPFRSKFNINSFYGLASVSYKDYLFLDVTGRNDWNSVLATATSTSNVSYFYPSVSGSAILSEIFNLPKVISYAKLRASYAGVGSGTQDAYRTAFVYNMVNGGYSGGLANSNIIANPNLKPLFTHTIEVGADMRFLDSRLGIDLAFYKSNTKDQILQNFIDPSAGHQYAIINAGEVENKGIEIQLNGTPVKSSRGLNWTLNGTFSANKNKVLSLPGDYSISGLMLQRGPGGRGGVVAQIGGSMGALYGIGYERAPDGQIIYGSNGMPDLTDTVKYIGNVMPKWRASIGNQFKYKNFSFSFLFDGQYGAVGYSLTAGVMAEQGKTTNTLPGRYNGIIGNGVIRNSDGTFRPNDVVATDVWNYYKAHYGRDNVEGSTYSTDFIKLRETRFDYTLPDKFIKRLGLQRVMVGIYGRDLLTITKWPAFDPEFGTISTDSQGSNIARGYELGQFPSTRTMGFNLTLGF